jgi:hypothetical protein
LRTNPGHHYGVTEKTAPLEPPSPCVRICTLDANRTWCLGCGRTLKEIGRWSTLSNETKQAILDDLPRRLATAS